MLLHLSIFGLCIFFFAKVPRGANGIEERNVGIVLVDRNSEKTEYLTEGDVLEAEEAKAATAAATSAAPQLNLPPDLPGLPSLDVGMQGIADSIADDLNGANDLVLKQANANVGGKVTTELFGLKGTGSRFVYLIDRSDSMSGRPMKGAKQQLLKSLQVLDETHQFQIIFYNRNLKRMKSDPLSQALFATEKAKQMAERFIRQIIPSGGTDHLEALKAALALKPDVIFFLTDADQKVEPLTQTGLDDVSRWNRAGTIINVVKFGESKGQSQMFQNLASENGGEFIFKNIHSLPLND